MPRKSKKNSVKATASSQTLTTDVGTQTENDEESSREVLSLQAQIESLQNELKLYKNQLDVFKKKTTTTEVLKTPKGTPKNEQKSFVNENKPIPGSGSKFKKGCTCKGSCSNSKCGCVKKGGFCEEFCKCSSSKCCNKDIDKENVNSCTLSDQDLKTLGNFENLMITPKISRGSATKTKSVTSHAFEEVQKISETEKSKFSNISTSRLRKLHDKKSNELVYAPGSEKSSSLSSSAKENSPSLKITRSATKKNLSKQKIDNESVSKHDNTSVPQELFKSDDDSPPVTINKVIHSPVGNDSVAASPHQFVAKRRYNVRKLPPKISVSTEFNFSESKLDSVPDKDADLNPMTAKSQLPRSPVQSKSEIDENVDCESFNPMIPRRQLPRSPVTSSTGSLSSNSEMDMDSSIHPMIPKRQLIRSPIKVGDNTILVQSKRFSPPPMKELAMEEVDWEQHQSELVQCKICKRKFWPHRLEKHEKHCKGY